MVVSWGVVPATADDVALVVVQLVVPEAGPMPSPTGVDDDGVSAVRVMATAPLCVTLNVKMTELFWLRVPENVSVVVAFGDVEF